LRLLDEEQGNALVEFSVTMPLLVLTFLGAVTLSLIIVQNLAITDAAYQAAKYGANGHNNDLAGMQNVANTCAAGVPGFTAVAQEYCTCTPGGGVVSCTATCFPYSTPFEYVTVTTSASVPVLYSFPGIANSVALSASSTLRVPWSGY
jgi:Flp pilus assembly protein TadG